MRTRSAVLRFRRRRLASRRVLPFALRCRQPVVVDLGALSGLESECGGQRRIARQGQSLSVEVVVDLAVAGGIPATVVGGRGGLPARIVIAQQMTDFVNQQRRILLDAVMGEPSGVVVEAPVTIDSHAADLIGFDRNEIEERWREIAALMRRANPSGLQLARIALFLARRGADQIEQLEAHVIPWEPASPSSSTDRTDDTPQAA